MARSTTSIAGEFLRPRNGIVRLTGEYIRMVGVPIEQISPWDLHIYNKGREIPIVVDGQEDGHSMTSIRIEFFGEREYPHLYRA